MMKRNYIDIATQIISSELQQANSLFSSLNKGFQQACDALQTCEGKVIVSGIGKSGHIGKKIAATLASTGTPAFFVHLAEALHGDLGMISPGDIVIFISNSGEANEFKTILPNLKQRGNITIALTNNQKSYLASHCSICLFLNVAQEACPMGLAPTASAVNTLILGDALALSVMVGKGFNEADFCFFTSRRSTRCTVIIKKRRPS